MTCQRCDSDRILDVISHAADKHAITINGYHPAPDYLPDDLGLGHGGDDLDISVCLECGQLQGDFPLDETEIEREADNH